MCALERDNKCGVLKWDNYRIAGLPPLKWGEEISGLECPFCGSHNIYLSGTPADPEEVMGDAVRCGDCGWLSDHYEMYKRRWGSDLIKEKGNSEK